MSDSLLAYASDDEQALIAAATELGRALATRSLMIVTAESCTGGGIARALTETAGSSEWFDSAFVTYSNRAKQRMLGVGAADLAAHGAVSEVVARAMAAGALAQSSAQVAISVTGVAGPGGGSPDKPVGTVWFGFARRLADPALPNDIECMAECHRIDGDRSAVRLRTALHAVRRAANLWL